MVKTFGLKAEFTPIKQVGNSYRIMWGYTPIVNDILDEEGNKVGEEESTLATWNIERFNHKPSMAEIKNLILDSINKEIDERILSGFVWNDMQVWLSGENQFNYKAAYDLAIQTNGANLPIKFKFGSNEEPIYYTFKSVGDLQDFYMSAMNFINTTLNEGWTKKDTINWEDYKYD